MTDASPAPSAPDLSEFDRLLMAVIEAVWWEALWDEEERTPHIERVRALDQTRAALRSYVASLIPGDDREKEPDAKCSGCGKRLQYTTNGVRGVLRGTFHYCANPECPLHLTARDDFPASTAVYADEIDSSSATPSALVEPTVNLNETDSTLREARARVTALGSRKVYLGDQMYYEEPLPDADLIRRLADALVESKRVRDNALGLNDAVVVRLATQRDSAYEALALANARIADTESRLALATADTERLDWMQLYIVDYTEEAGDDMNEAIAELTGDLAIDLEVALIESRGDVRTAIDAARSSSLTDTPEGA